MCRAIAVLLASSLAAQLTPGVGLAATIQSGTEALVFEAEDYDGLTGGRFIPVDHINPPEHTTSPPESVARPVLPAGSQASMGGALYSYPGGSTSLASYDVQFATAGTYYGYVRYTLFNIVNGSGNNYGNEDSFFFSRAFDTNPVTAGSLDAVDTGYSGYSPINNPLEGLRYLWLQMRYRPGLEKNGIREVHYVIDDGDLTGEASIGSLLQLRMQNREAGATPDLFVLSTTSGLTSGQLEAFVTLVPEPSTLAMLLGLGGIGLLGYLRRRRKS